MIVLGEIREPAAGKAWVAKQRDKGVPEETYQIFVPLE